MYPCVLGLAMEAGHHPNIVWIVIDALRADHTTMDGYERNTTPNIQAIADEAQGTAVSNCFSHAIATRPSVSSMLTGVYPSAHGVNMIENAIPSELQTVPELLSEAGYQSVAISRNSHVSRATGLHRGFDEFDWFGSVSSLLETVDIDILLKYLLGIRNHSVGFSTDLVDHSIAYIVNELAKRNIRRLNQDANPYFMFLHYLGPHDPYLPPIPYQERYLADLGVDRKTAIQVVNHVKEHNWEYNTGKLELTEEESEILRAMYDAEVAYTDACVGELFDFITEQDSPNETLFIITADHGELLGERNVIGHEFHLDDALLNVPLVIHGPGSEHVQSDALVQHIDLVKTLVEDISGEVEQLQGVDLVSDERDWIVSERCQPLDFDDLTDINPDFDPSSIHGDSMRALRTREFKLIRSATETDLYKLPDEDTDLSAERSVITTQLRDELEQWQETFGQPIGTAREANLSADMKQQLTDLGYLVD